MIVAFTWPSNRSTHLRTSTAVIMRSIDTSDDCQFSISFLIKDDVLEQRSAWRHSFKVVPILRSQTDSLRGMCRLPVVTTMKCCLSYWNHSWQISNYLKPLDLKSANKEISNIFILELSSDDTYGLEAPTILTRVLPQKLAFRLQEFHIKLVPLHITLIRLEKSQTAPKSQTVPSLVVYFTTICQ